MYTNMQSMLPSLGGNYDYSVSLLMPNHNTAHANYIVHSTVSITGRLGPYIVRLNEMIPVSLASFQFHRAPQELFNNIFHD